MRIALVLNILNEEYQISVYSGIKARSQSRGVTLVCFQQENLRFLDGGMLPRFPSADFFGLDGILFLTSVSGDEYEARDLARFCGRHGNLPAVSIGQKVEGIPSILVSAEDSLRELLEHLVETHGYRSFLFIGGAKTHQDAELRERTFCRTMEQYQQIYPGLTFVVKEGCFTEQSAIATMEEYFSEHPGARPDAVVCANDNMAIGVNKFFKLRRADSCIRECAVTGFDDTPQARFEIPSLTTIRQPLAEIGAMAVDCLLDLIEKKEPPPVQYIGSGLVLRDSCGCHVYTDEMNSKLLAEMQTKYVQSERLMRMTSRIGQELNYAQEISLFKYLINENLDELDIRNFCIVLFGSGNSAEPLYVRKDGVRYEDSFEKNLLFGDFFTRYLSLGGAAEQAVPLVFKYLMSGQEIIGGILYDSEPEILPYICSVGVNISQSISRINAFEKRRLHSEYLENEVSKRTHELLEANERRMKVEAEVLRISEIERQRFSTDLHDDICQRLAGISMLCRSYAARNEPVGRQQMAELAELISDTLQTTRQYAHNSYPVELEGLGLNHSLSNLCNSFQKQSGISCAYEWSVRTGTDFDTIQRLNIFRIVQEALHNVLKHSGASQVLVRVTSEDEAVLLEVSDDGCGFFGASAGQKHGLGLNSMQYRANQIGASFQIRPNVPHGTVVAIKLNKAEERHEN